MTYQSLDITTLGLAIKAMKGSLFQTYFTRCTEIFFPHHHASCKISCFKILLTCGTFKPEGEQRNKITLANLIIVSSCTNLLLFNNVHLQFRYILSGSPHRQLLPSFAQDPRPGPARPSPSAGWMDGYWPWQMDRQTVGRQMDRWTDCRQVVIYFTTAHMKKRLKTSFVKSSQVN